MDEPLYDSDPVVYSGTTVPEASLLVVDDDANILELLSASLRYAGFDVETASSGTQALEILGRTNPDLVVLDVMMPGLDGFEVLRRHRALGRNTPVLFLTARDSTQDRVGGLNLGADDYLTKPFSLEEALARIRAVLRRTGPTHSDAVEFAGISLDATTHDVHVGGAPVDLSPTEFRLLEYFLTNPNRVLSKAQILTEVWGYDFLGAGNVVESYVSYLRRKVDPDASLLQTVRGVGYILRSPR